LIRKLEIWRTSPTDPPAEDKDEEEQQIRMIFGDFTREETDAIWSVNFVNLFVQAYRDVKRRDEETKDVEQRPQGRQTPGTITVEGKGVATTSTALSRAFFENMLTDDEEVLIGGSEEKKKVQSAAVLKSSPLGRGTAQKRTSAETRSDQDLPLGKTRTPLKDGAPSPERNAGNGGGGQHILNERQGEVMPFSSQKITAAVKPGKEAARDEGQVGGSARILDKRQGEVMPFSS